MKVNTLAYGIEVVDDEKFAENAFYILASCGQDGGITMVITSMAIDGGVAGARNVLFDGSGTPEEITATIRETLANFRDEHYRHGQRNGFLNRDDIATIVEEFIDYYALET
jgi:hypothetical protein